MRYPFPRRFNRLARIRSADLSAGPALNRELT
jgi:hypothetical protein